MSVVLLWVQIHTEIETTTLGFIYITNYKLDIPMEIKPMTFRLNYIEDYIDWYQQN